MMAESCGQRAEAGLIISEATAISPQAYGWHQTPGIYNAEQVEAWKPPEGKMPYVQRGASFRSFPNDSSEVFASGLIDGQVAVEGMLYGLTDVSRQEFGGRQNFYFGTLLFDRNDSR